VVLASRAQPGRLGTANQGPQGWYGSVPEMTGTSSKMLRERQLEWALAGGIPATALEVRRGRVSWVLKQEHRKRNLYRAEWWKYIEGKEHRWARALNSSQCFAVNLFAPLAEDRSRAIEALRLLLPSRRFESTDTISVRFEYTPEGGPDWFGERRQPTQIDVYFEIIQSDRHIGHVLVEVKFTETSFGRCRGWVAKQGHDSHNPDRSRCLDASMILASPQTKCWLAQVEGRRYWEIMAHPASSIRQDTMRLAEPCPFRHGLYQMMRNRLLADELARRTRAEWGEFVVCRHPSNDMVLTLKEPVLSTTNAVDAFRRISSDNAVRDWNAEHVLTAVRSTDERLIEWEQWMLERYFGSPLTSPCPPHPTSNTAPS